MICSVLQIPSQRDMCGVWSCWVSGTRTQGMTSCSLYYHGCNFSVLLQLLGTFVFQCVCVCGHAHLCTSTETRGGLRKLSFITFSLTSSSHGCSASPIELPVSIHPQSAWYWRHVYGHPWHFTWVLGIHSQVLMFAQQILLPTEPSPHQTLSQESIFLTNAKIKLTGTALWVARY